MALIKCPECGREKVSDTAVSCPDCGYGIKAHFESKRKEEERNKRKIEEHRAKEKKQAQLEKKRQLEHEKMLKEHPEMAKAIAENDLKNAQKKLEEAQARKDYLVKRLKEEKQSELKAKIGVLIWAVAWTIICIWSFSASEEGSLGLIIVISFFCALAGWALLIISNGSVTQIENDIEIASKSVEEYQKLVDIRWKNTQLEREKRKAEEALKHPKCPNCGRTNTERISTADRAVSVAMVGVASGKIGKQYKCKDCKHMW